MWCQCLIIWRKLPVSLLQANTTLSFCLSLPLSVSYSEASASLTAISILLAVCDLDVLRGRQGVVCVYSLLGAQAILIRTEKHWHFLPEWNPIVSSPFLYIYIKGFLQSTRWCVFVCVAAYTYICSVYFCGGVAGDRCLLIWHVCTAGSAQFSGKKTEEERKKPFFFKKAWGHTDALGDSPLLIFSSFNLSLFSHHSFSFLPLCLLLFSSSVSLFSFVPTQTQHCVR